MAIQFQKTDVYRPVAWDTHMRPTEWAIDARDSTKATAGNAARAYQGAADDAMAGAVGAAQQGVGYANQGIAAARQAQSGVNTALAGLTDAYNRGLGSIAKIDDSLRKINLNYQAATDAANSMGLNIGQVEGQAAALRPYASDLNSFASTMWQQGNSLFNTGQGIIGQGQSLMNMDASAGGLVGEYVNWLNTIDPNRYVSMATSDVQSSFNNAQGQLNRQLTRAGSDASSTRTAAMQQQMSQSLAAALAGAKTRARMQGLSDQGKALQAALGQAQELLTQGAGISRYGTEAESQAGTLKSKAADVEATSGKLYAEAGSLRASQSQALTQAGQLAAQGGNLAAKGGDIALQAGQLMAKYGDLSISSAQTLVKAYGDATAASDALAKMQASAGTYYAQVAQGYGSMAGDVLFGAEGLWGGQTRTVSHKM